jgi:hypothetical protein
MLRMHSTSDGINSAIPANSVVYLHEADVERRLTLESYGYRFLRLNRFNLGTDPVAKPSERLDQVAALRGTRRIQEFACPVNRPNRPTFGGLTDSAVDGNGALNR